MDFESILDENKKVYKFDGNVHSKVRDYKSKIRAEYLLKNIENNTDKVFVCLDKGKVESVYSAVSVICPDEDYSRGQHEECMLIKKKFLKQNITEILFIHPSYFKNHLELAETEMNYINKTPELKAILEAENT